MFEEEDIMVIARNALFGENDERAFNGFMSIEKVDFLPIIKDSLVARPRTEMENDPTYKQVIPYTVFSHDGKLFLYRRTKNSGEARLHDKYSIGVGGHMNPAEGDVIIAGMEREFHEELIYNDEYEYEIVGFINDDSDDVGKVHFGVVFLVRGKTPDIEVAEKDKLEGGLVTLDEVEGKRSLLEKWSSFTLDGIKDIIIQ
ncbi:MAG: NUDIX domain-containing protein [Candidatus Micrarchaeota archaeon]|nr:NUDIX domain-containing protein [Candidatus Micrarchaeota archaeon]